MNNTCARCGSEWQSEADAAIVHKTTLCAKCKRGDIPVVSATRSEISARMGLATVVRESGRKTEHTFEDVPVFFNDTMPPGVLAAFGDDADSLELHGREDAYHATMADDRMREATRRMVRMIRQGLRARAVRRKARLN